MIDHRPHRKLVAWQKSMELVQDVYKAVTGFPKYEEYGLISQMRRAAISIPSNIAEGAARRGNKEFMQFLNIAQGSISELDTQLELARMMGYIDTELHTDLAAKLTDISKLLFGLTRSVK
jgi:four helix bundle protein